MTNPAPSNTAAIFNPILTHYQLSKNYPIQAAGTITTKDHQ